MPIIMAPFPAVARPAASEKPLKPGPIAVFVSRKEGKLFVRKGFEPVFNVPVKIANPDQPLGNHVFTAVELINDGAAMRWLAVTVPSERRVVDRSHNNSRNSKGRRNTDRGCRANRGQPECLGSARSHRDPAGNPDAHLGIAHAGSFLDHFRSRSGTGDRLGDGLHRPHKITVPLSV